jgi:oligopeptide/dipeptide ABC transporter ATP-binding protein
MSESHLLELDDLRCTFVSGGGWGRAARVVKAVDGVSLTVKPAETVAIVGESGSGKTTLARVVVGLRPQTSGCLTFDGQALDWRLRSSRGLRSRIQMIFQDPMGSLDPRWRVSDLVREPLDNFSPDSRAAKTRRVDEILERVGLDSTQRSKRAAELSGGQRQRIGIARAIVLRPNLVVCDEPVSALDVSIRGQILDLLVQLRRDFGLTYVYISHDLGTVRKLADRVMTMYLGQVVELAQTREFFAQPLHPYAQALLSAVPLADPRLEQRRCRIILEGEAADAARVPSGCRFHPRCPLAQDRCVQQEPELREVLPGRWVRCHFAPDAVIPQTVVQPSYEQVGVA